MTEQLRLTSDAVFGLQRIGGDSGLNVVIQWIRLISSDRVVVAKITRPNDSTFRHPIDSYWTRGT